MKNLALSALTLSLLATPAFSDEISPNCKDAEFRQLDFWVGDWNLSWQGGNGTNHIKKSFEACVIEENFDGHPSQHLKGHSVSVYDAPSKQWKQTWVDNEGGYLDFIGDFKDGQMTLQREAVQNGQKTLQRMVWKNITANELDWSWEASTDGGKTWQVNWPVHYKRAH